MIHESRCFQFMDGIDFDFTFFAYWAKKGSITASLYICLKNRDDYPNIVHVKADYRFMCDFVRQYYSYRELLNMIFSRKSFRDNIVIALTEDVHSLMRTSEWTFMRRSPAGGSRDPYG